MTKRGPKPLGDKPMTNAQRQMKRMTELKQKAANFDTMGRLGARATHLESAINAALAELDGIAEEARKGINAFSEPSFEPMDSVLYRRIDAARKILRWARATAL